MREILMNADDRTAATFTRQGIPGKKSVAMYLGFIGLSGFALLALQSSDQVGLTKLALLASVLLVAGHAATSLVRNQTQAKKYGRMFTLLMAFSALTIALVVFAAPNAFSAFRECIPYLMILPFATIAVSLTARVSRGQITFAVYLLGTMSAALVAYNWVGRRGALADAFTGNAGLSSAVLPAFALVYAINQAQTARDTRARIGHSLIVVALLALMLLSGTRTNLVLLIPIVLAAWLQSRDNGGGNVSRRVSTLIAGTLGLAALWLVGGALGLTQFITNRFSMLQDFSANSLISDQSFQIRQYAYQVGFEKFISSPVLGNGFQPTDLSLFDTPFGFLTNLGLVGAMLVVMIYRSLFVVAERSSGTRLDARRVLLLFGVTLICLIPFGAVVDDKGFAIAFGLAIIATTGSIDFRTGSIRTAS